MITAAQTEYESPISKVWRFSTSIIALIAGDTAFQTELLFSVYQIVHAEIQKNPSNWWRVEDVAFLYREAYYKARSERLERKILQPLGLSVSGLLSRRRELGPVLFQDLMRQMWDFTPPETETIFMGVDDTGAHIWLWLNGELLNRDTVGFAAIGGGHAHAESEMMTSRHGWSKPLAETVVTVHAAKKRAEAAPGVGKETDIYAIGPGVGTLVHINNWNDGEAVATLDHQYELRVRGERRAAEKSRKEFESYIQDAIALPQSSPPSPPTDEAASAASATSLASSEPALPPALIPGAAAESASPLEPSRPSTHRAAPKRRRRGSS